MPSAVQPSTNISQLPKLTPRKREPDHAEPPPPTPALSDLPDLTNHTYIKPVRRILSPRDHDLFLSSKTYQLIVAFVFTLSDSVRDTTISTVERSPQAQDATILKLLSILEEADDLIKECPALDTGSRFGNPAFRDYIAKVQEKLPAWHQRLGVDGEEIPMYLAHSFGDASRLDYGSGHELNFVLWLLCLRQVSLLPKELFPVLALLVFPRYLRLMRDIQSTYYLEPAGSHGVWGLDDYQFLPFLLGASQLVNHKFIRPRSIHNETIVEECSKDYLYLDQVRWVNSTKTVQGLRWHSPMLDDISAAKSWAKVEGGMRKMFLAEVLGKLPVAQHFLFGSLLPAERDMTENSADMHDSHSHEHGANSWGDCCGIKVPSAIGARQEAGKTSELRRLPFD